MHFLENNRLTPPARVRAGNVVQRGPGGLTPPTASKVHKKERILQALTRMNDRDTAKAAADDLLSILHNMDQASLPIVLSCLCTTSSEHKVYARKECARALGVIASEACPLRDQALAAPHLAKMLGQLRRSLQDADSGVREASAEALAQVACGLAALGPGCGNGGAANPVLKLLFECLGEQRKELNAAACSALGMAAPYLGTLDAPLARELVRKLGAPSFQAPAPLLAALARTEPGSGEPVGLIRSGPAAFVPLMSSLIGQPPQPASGAGSGSAGASGGGGGAVGALARPEWAVRQAAADMLRATALLLGPLMEAEGCWAAADPRCLTGRALRGLESCRFDKVREVRDVARAALAVYEELQEYGSGGGSAAGWPAHIAERLLMRGLPVPGPALSPAPAVPPAPAAPPPGRKSPLRRSSPGPGPALAARRRASPSPERRSSPLALARDSSLAERFRAAHRAGEIAVLDPLGPVDFAALEAAARAEEQEEEDAESGEGGGAGRLALEQQQAESPAAAWLGAQLRGRGGAPADGAPGLASRTPSPQASQAASGSGRGANQGPPLESQFSVRSNASQQPRASPLQPEGSAVSRHPGYGLLQGGAGEDDDEPLTWDGSDGPPTFARQISEAAQAAESSQEPPPDPSPAPALTPSLSRVDSHLSARSSGPPAAPIPAWPAASTPPPFAAPSGASAAAATAAAAPTGPATAEPPEAEAAGSLGATVTLPTEEWLASQQRLRSLESQQRELLDAFSSLSEQSSAAISGLQAKVRSLEAALETANARNLASAAPQPPAPAQQQQPAQTRPAPQTTPPTQQQQQQQQQPRQQPQQGSAHAQLQRQPQSAPPASATPDSERPPLLMRTIRPGSPLSLELGGSGAAAEGPSPRVSAQLPPVSPGLRAGQAASGGPACSSEVYSEARQAYREALSGGRPGDMHLLRLLQRTGPIWNELGHELSCQLLAAFTANLQHARADGPMLLRILPWLWRLADDEHNSFEAPTEMRAALLAALRVAQPAVNDPTLHERVALLINTLQAHWSLSDTRDVIAPARGPQPAEALTHPPPRSSASYGAPSASHPGPVPAFRPYAPAASSEAVHLAVADSSASAPPVQPASSLQGGEDVSDARDQEDGPQGSGSTDEDQGQEPEPAAAVAMPRLGGALRALAAPSFNTLMGQWSDLQRDFAAMASPGGVPGRPHV